MAYLSRVDLETQIASAISIPQLYEQYKRARTPTVLKRFASAATQLINGYREHSLSVTLTTLLLLSCPILLVAFPVTEQLVYKALGLGVIAIIAIAASSILARIAANVASALFDSHLYYVSYTEFCNDPHTALAIKYSLLNLAKTHTQNLSVPPSISELGVWLTSDVNINITKEMHAAATIYNSMSLSELLHAIDFDQLCVRLSMREIDDGIYEDGLTEITEVLSTFIIHQAAMRELYTGFWKKLKALHTHMYQKSIDAYIGPKVNYLNPISLHDMTNIGIEATMIRERFQVHRNTCYILPDPTEPKEYLH